MQAAGKVRFHPGDLLAAVREFLASASQPALLEPGEEPILLIPGNHALNTDRGILTLECWDETRNLVRRLRSLKSRQGGRLEFETEQFGGKTGSLLLLDLARPQARSDVRRGSRLQYRERFRRSLRRQFPEWKLVELSTEPDLHHSLSPAYARAFLRRGAAGLAAIGASESCLEPDGVLTFGLIWLDYLRTREPRVGIEGLVVFLPLGAEWTTCQRIRYLQGARYQVFVQGPDGLEDPVDPAEYTNLHTQLDPFRQPLLEGNPAAWTARIAAIPGVEQRPHPDGSLGLSIRGLEFARFSGGRLLFGLDQKQPALGERHLREIEEWIQVLLRMRSADAQDRTNQLYTRHPEAWLECQIRRHIQKLDALLEPEPVYAQTPHLAGKNRGILDLLAGSRDGRLAVIEVKASEDIHLPLQALDYWMHVKWHLDRGEFTAAGYFPGIELRRDPPRLLLVAPALDFHPTNGTVLQYFRPEVAAERVGIGLQWRQELEVMFRSPGNAWPSQSYGRSEKRSGL